MKERGVGGSKRLELDSSHWSLELIHEGEMDEGQSIKHTNGGRFDHVADGEPLDGLVLGGASRAVGAPDGLGVAATLLVAAVILSLLDHIGGLCAVLETLGRSRSSRGGFCRRVWLRKENEDFFFPHHFRD